MFPLKLKGDNDMNFWHMQMHPGDENFPLQKINEILEKNFIGMANEWKNDRDQPRFFKDNLRNGDIVMIRHQSSPRYLVKVVGDVENNPYNREEIWCDIIRKIEILSNEGETLQR